MKGFRYMVENLELHTAVGRKMLYNQQWMCTRDEVEFELKCVEEVYGRVMTQKNEVERIVICLERVKDINGTIDRIGEGVVLDDLELFELKGLALICAELREFVTGWHCVAIPDLEGVVELLDPEKTRIPYFYICDAFSEELATLRGELKYRKQQGEQEEVLEKLYWQSVQIEDDIRRCLSVRLSDFQSDIRKALEGIGRLDILIAKACQALNLGLVKPTYAEHVTKFSGLFHPQLREILRKERKVFQTLDLALAPKVTLVTGANMAGKTVLLKSVALAQCLLQYGFYVPARSAEMVLVDGLRICIGDEQDELNGLSSFASEMLRLNDVIVRVRNGEKLLVLLDELARTTNPTEGQAIVSSTVDFLTEHHTMALVTTHYSDITAECRKLRVKGFVEEKLQGNKLTLKNINEFIDYSLVEDEEGTVPHEALRIAALLGVDSELLKKAEKQYRKYNIYEK